MDGWMYKFWNPVDSYGVTRFYATAKHANFSITYLFLIVYVKTLIGKTY